MDNQKDQQRTESVTKFLDYQTMKSNPFGDNRVGERIYKRAERIASAVVLLTKHIENSDPIKNQAQTTVVDLLSRVIALKDEMRSPNSPKSDDLKMTVRKTMSLLRLLGVSGQVSLQNAEIVIDALDELLSFLVASRKSALSESIAINRDELSDMREVARFSERITERPAQSVEVVNEAPAVTALADIKQAGFVSTSSRSRAILEVLRQRGEMGIREVAANLPEYSEKMIQRELMELVTAGRVKKTGLKRWSRYTYIEGA